MSFQLAGGGRQYFLGATSSITKTFFQTPRSGRPSPKKQKTTCQFPPLALTPRGLMKGEKHHFEVFFGHAGPFHSLKGSPKRGFGDLSTNPLPEKTAGPRCFVLWAGENAGGNLFRFICEPLTFHHFFFKTEKKKKKIERANPIIFLKAPRRSFFSRACSGLM